MEDYAKKALELKNRLKNSPKDTTLMNDLAIALMECNEFEKALTYFESAVEMEPSVQSLHNLAYFYYSEGIPVGDGVWRDQEDKALELLLQTLSLSPNSHFPYSLIGEIYTVNEEYDKAKTFLQKAISLQPTLENVNNLGVCYYFSHSLPEAVKYFHLANLQRGKGNISLNPLLSYGMCLAKLGRISEARSVAKEIIELCKDRTHDIEIEDVADLFYEIGDYDTAVDVYANSTLAYSPHWLPRYFYSLKQAGQISKLDEVLQNVISQAEEEIRDALNDDEDWTLKEREQYIFEIRTNISNYKKSHQDIINGRRPQLEFWPAVEKNCYLFGCIRHKHPHYTE